MKAKKVFRLILLLLALLSSPFACIGAGSVMLAFTNVDIGFFNASTYIQNQSDETLYLTPITTTYAEPRVIVQMRYFRYKELPLRSGASVRLSYDAADNPMDGIVLCRGKGDCRFLKHEWQDIQSFDNFDTLPPVEDSWLTAIQKAPKYNIQLFIFAAFALTPFALLAIWWWIGETEKT